MNNKYINSLDEIPIIINNQGGILYPEIGLFKNIKNNTYIIIDRINNNKILILKDNQYNKLITITNEFSKKTT